MCGLGASEKQYNIFTCDDVVEGSPNLQFSSCNFLPPLGGTMGRRECVQSCSSLSSSWRKLANFLHNGGASSVSEEKLAKKIHRRPCEFFFAAQIKFRENGVNESIDWAVSQTTLKYKNEKLRIYCSLCTHHYYTHTKKPKQKMKFSIL